MKRRTQSLQSMIEKVNKYLEDSPDSEIETRKQLASILESLLMEAGCYRGFQYLYWDKQGFKEWNENGCPDFPEKDKYIYGPSMDQSRVVYY